MDILIAMVKDMAVIAVLASFCEMLLPESDVKKPIHLIFGLYFMILMLNPLVRLWTDVDFSQWDFTEMGAERIEVAAESWREEDVYEEAAKILASEMEGKLNAAYAPLTFEAEVKMSKEGFRSVAVIVRGGGSAERVLRKEIKELFAKEYGVPGDVLTVTFS